MEDETLPQTETKNDTADSETTVASGETAPSVGDSTTDLDSNSVAAEGGGTLLSKIEGISGLTREENETGEVYKARIVRYFSQKYPNTDEGNAAFEALPEDVAEWVNVATAKVAANRGARKPERIPELSGLVEDPQEEKRGRGRPAANKEGTAAVVKEPKEPKAPKEPRPPREPASGHILQKSLANLLKDAGFKRVVGRNPEEGRVEYAKDEEAIYVREADPEQKYISSWRSNKSTKDWQRGAKSLNDYLNPGRTPASADTKVAGEPTPAS